MAGDITFGIRLTADGSGYVGTVRLARDETEKLGLAARKAGGDIEAANKQSMASAVALGTVIGQFAQEAVKAMANWAVETVSAAARLKDLHDITGSTVEDLSRLTNVAKVSGFEGLNTALERLSVGLSGTDEESQKAGKALAALGIQSRDPAKAMQEIAEKFAGFADDVNKAAYAQAVFGRGGAQLLPYLKDLAEQQGIAATVTLQQAIEAQRLEQSLRRLSVEASVLRDSLLSGLVPAMNGIITQFQAARAAGLGWFESLSVAGVDSEKIVPLISEMGKKVDYLRTSFAEMNDPKNSHLYDADALAALGLQLDKATAKWKLYIQIRDNAIMANVAAMGYTGDVNDQRAGNFAGKPTLGAPPVGGAGRKEVDEYAKALADLAKQAALASEELDAVFTGDKVVPAMKSLLALMNDPTWDKFTAKQQLEIQLRASMVIGTQQEAEATRKLLDATKAEIEADEKAAEAKQRVIDQRVEVVRAYQQGNEDLARENALIGQSELAYKLLHAEMETEAAIRRVQGEGSEEAIRLLQEELEARKKLITEGFNRTEFVKQLDEQKQAWKQTYESIRDGITDSLLNAWANGKSGAKALLAELKSMFANLVLRPIIQATVAPLAGSLTSLLSGAAQAAGGGGLFGGGGGGFLSSLTSLFKGGGADANPAFLGGATSLFSGGGLEGVLGSLMSAAPWAAIGAIAIPLVAKLFDKGPANRTATFASGNLGSDPSRDAVYSGSSAFGQFGIAKDFWLGPESGQAFKPTIDAITQLDNTISKMVGGDLTKQITDALASHTITVGFGKEGTDINASGGPAAILKDRYATVLGAIDAQLGTMVEAFQGTGEELANFVVGLVSLRKTLGDSFKNLDASSITALGDAFGGIDKLASSLSFLNANFVSEADNAAKAGQNLADSFGQLGLSVPATHQAFLDLLSSFDLTTDSGRSLYASVMNLSGAFVEVNGTATQAAAALQQSFANLNSAVAAYNGVPAGQQKSDQLTSLLNQLVISTGNTGWQEMISTLGQQGFVGQLALLGQMPDEFAKFSASNQALITQIIGVAADIKSQAPGASSGVVYPGDSGYPFATGGGDSASAIVDDTLQALKRLRDGILDYVNSLKLGDLSPLTPAQKLAEAKSQYEATLTKAQTGDQSALGNITGAADAYLKISRDFFASSQAYTDIFSKITSQLTELGGGISHSDVPSLTVPQPPTVGPSSAAPSSAATPADVQGMADGIITAIYDAAASAAKSSAEDAAKIAASVERSKAALIEAITVGLK